MNEQTAEETLTRAHEAAKLAALSLAEAVDEADRFKHEPAYQEAVAENLQDYRAAYKAWQDASNAFLASLSSQPAGRS